jgi:KDO2-lipid IV(A) lauroyltransferase
VLKYALFWFVFRVLGLLPAPVLYTIAEGVGWLGYRLFPGVRAQVLDNVSHVLPNASQRKRDRVAKRVFRNVAYYYADLAHMRRMDLDEFFTKRLVFHGVRERMLARLTPENGAVMLSAHYGNPEIVGQGMISLGHRVFAVTEPVEPPALAAMMNEIRSCKGLEFRPVSVASAKKILRLLKSGGIVALMGDRDILGPRMKLPFFGVETWMPTGPIEAGLRTGAPIYPCFCRRIGRTKWEAWLEEPLTIERTDDFQADVKTATLQYISRLEWWLRNEPEQWGVLERIWDDPASENKGEATEPSAIEVS